MGNFTDSPAWKGFVIKFGGVAAAVVIFGALFKIQHWPGASIMLTLGMSTEVLIFLLSALDTYHPDPDWALVYPELKHDAADTGEKHASSKDKKHLPAPVTAEVASPNKLVQEVPEAQIMGATKIDLSGVDTSKITKGLEKLGSSFEQLGALTATVKQAEALSEQLQKASSTVGNFSNSYEQSSMVLSESVNILSDTYQGAASNLKETTQKTSGVIIASGEKVAHAVEDSVNQMAETYRTATDNISAIGKQASDSVFATGQQMAQVISSATDSFAETFTLIDGHIRQNLDNIKNGNANYNKNIDLLNKNMSALNTTYELQVKSADKFQKNTIDIATQLEAYVADLAKSTQENQEFRKGISHLNSNIAELNNIYGSMLSAVQMAMQKK
ncbi:hypothetical protein AGMMS4956_15410 [Bacteroidia bacterium]|nr:hypothetical protein AGMMS4956_15410 [Bacteroidia bacterium]